MNGPEPAHADEETSPLATATLLVGAIAYAATWLLWHGRAPLPLDRSTLWTTLLLLGIPLAGLYSLTTADLTDLGFERGVPDRAWKHIVGGVAVSIPFCAAAALFPALAPQAPISGELGAYGSLGVALLLLWRAFVLEWFFRGFLLFGWLPRMGAPAIFLQAIPFGALYYGARWPEAVAAWPAGIALGFVAWRCRSFLPAAAIHGIVAMLLFALTLIRP